MTSPHLYSYVVARDYGFAPNPFHGFCTLATCKPDIRGSAKEGAWVVGTGSKAHRLEGHVVYAMRVTAVRSFDEYWQGAPFICKRPNFHGSLMQAFGDNIYHRDPQTGHWIQENSHHSLPDGSENKKNKERDLKADRVLISDDFYYFGQNAPQIPDEIRAELCKKGPGIKSVCFSRDFAYRVVYWLRDFRVKGYLGEPVDWGNGI